jgi:hypothetical protein
MLCRVGALKLESGNGETLNEVISSTSGALTFFATLAARRLSKGTH